MKERITITLEKDLLTQIDSYVNGSEVKNRSHAVELLLLRSMGKNRPKKALILAGGSKVVGSKKVLKPLVTVGGMSLIAHNIELLKKHDITDIVISLGQNGETIRRYLGNGDAFGVKINYMLEKDPAGTAGPLKMAKDLLTETFVMLNADELKDVDLEDMFKMHQQNKAIATIALTTVPDPSEYGVALMHGNKIVTFIERPPKQESPSNLINAGLYIMEPSVIDYVPQGYAMLEHEVFPKLASDEKLYGYIFGGKWFGLRGEKDFVKAEKEWA